MPGWPRITLFAVAMGSFTIDDAAKSDDTVYADPASSGSHKWEREENTLRKLTVAVAAVASAAAMLVVVPVGSGATPQQIYRDFADNGHLDGHYSASDLQRALKDAVVQGYGGPTGKQLAPAVKKKAGQVLGGQKSVSPPPVKASTSGLPFTGFDLALISIGALLLLAFGVGLRRFARRTG